MVVVAAIVVVVVAAIVVVVDLTVVVVVVVEGTVVVVVPPVSQSLHLSDHEQPPCHPQFKLKPQGWPVHTPFTIRA